MLLYAICEKDINTFLYLSFGYRALTLKPILEYAFLIVIFIAQVKLFIKAGEKWWKILIPGYGQYVQYRIARCKWMFWVMLVLVAGMIVSCATMFAWTMRYRTSVIANTAFYVMLMCEIAALMLNIIYCVKLTKAFGKGKGFSLGLIVLHPFFMLILAFGSAAYLGAAEHRPANTIGVIPAQQSRRIWRCAGCGAENDHNELYCQNCGMRMP